MGCARASQSRPPLPRSSESSPAQNHIEETRSIRMSIKGGCTSYRLKGGRARGRLLSAPRQPSDLRPAGGRSNGRRIRSFVITKEEDGSGYARGGERAESHDQQRAPRAARRGAIRRIRHRISILRQRRVRQRRVRRRRPMRRKGWASTPKAKGHSRRRHRRMPW